MSTLPLKVILLPSLLRPEDVEGRSVVVFDVLRATTTMTAALAAGIEQIHLYPTLDAARAGHAAAPAPKLLLGEEACLKPADFDLGNSPAQFTSAHVASTLHMATTNGTRALLAPASLATPREVLVGSLINRLAVAKALVALAAPITLLCAGTDGHPAYEDLLGCGAVIDSLINLHALGPVNDSGLMAMASWNWASAGIVRAKPNEPAYPAGFRLASGAINLQKAGLLSDVAFSARPDVVETVGILRGTVVTKNTSN